MPCSDSSGKSNVNRGREYEQLAADYLSKQGFEIVARNHQEGHLEIDIIARDQTSLVFVEVKAAATSNYGHPSEWVDARKQERLVRAAESYLQKYPQPGLDLRFDVITFVKGKLEHYPNAFGV